VDSNTTLLVVFFGSEGDLTISSVAWNTSETMTEIGSVTTSSSGGDVRVWAFGLVNPTTGSHSVSYSVSGSGDNAWAVPINYLGTETSSVANATNLIDSDDNGNNAAATVAMSGSTTSGSTLVIGGTFRGADGDPASESNDGNFSTIQTGDTGGGSTSTDTSYYVGDYIVGGSGGTISPTINWTGSASDECVGVFFEILEPTTTFDDERQSLLDGIDGDLSETHSWDNERSNLPVSNVARTSHTVATITLSALADYDISELETLTITVPGSILAGGSPLVASPTIEIDYSALNHYTLTCDGGNFDYAGQATGLLATRTLSLATGGFDYAGQAVGFQAARTLSLETGGFDYAGQAVGLLSTRTLSLATGGFDYAGQAVGLLAGRALAIENGNFDYAGQDVGFVHSQDYILSCESGNFDYAGQAVGLLATRVLSLESGNFDYAGQDVTLRHGYSLSLDGGNFDYAGQALGFLVDRVLEIENGNFNYAGQDVGLVYIGSYSIIIDTGGFGYAGQDVGLYRGLHITVENGGFDYAGQAVSLLADRMLSLESGNFNYAGQAVGLLKNSALPIGSGSFGYAGQDVMLQYGRFLSLASGGFSYAGQDVAFHREYSLLLESGGFTYAGQAVIFYGPVRIPVTVFTMATSTGTFTLSIPTGELEMAPQDGAFVLSTRNTTYTL
jgi:hypothetical protein